MCRLCGGPPYDEPWDDDALDEEATLRAEQRYSEQVYGKED